MLIAGLLSGIEAALPLLGGLFHIAPGLFAVLSGMAVAGAFVTRFFAQKGFHNET